jgi:hypothetical protein
MSATPDLDPDGVADMSAEVSVWSSPAGARTV